MLPVAAHMPNGGSACMSLIEALRSRDVGDDADEVGVRASSGAAGAASRGVALLLLSGTGMLGVEGGREVGWEGASLELVLTLADVVA